MIPTTKAKQRIVLRKLLDNLRDVRGAALVDVLIALDDAADTIGAVLAQLHNRRMGPVARRTSVTVTPAVAAQIQRIHASDPDLPQQDVGAMVGVNLGRVNETLRGKRT